MCVCTNDVLFRSRHTCISQSTLPYKLVVCCNRISNMACDFTVARETVADVNL